MAVCGAYAAKYETGEIQQPGFVTGISAWDDVEEATVRSPLFICFAVAVSFHGQWFFVWPCAGIRTWWLGR